MDIRSVDGKYSEPDKTIARIIDMLAIGDAKDRTDLEYHQYRDVLAFQIGEPVSGKSYEAERSILSLDDPTDEKKLLKELIDIDSVPFDLGDAEIWDNGTWNGCLFFDEQNGVRIADLQQHIEIIYGNLVKKDVKNAYFYFYYSRYEQDVLYIEIWISDGILTGHVNRNGEQVREAWELFHDKYPEGTEMDDIPKEFAILRPLYEFYTIEDLPKALAAASAFAGVK